MTLLKSSALRRRAHPLVNRSKAHAIAREEGIQLSEDYVKTLDKVTEDLIRKSAGRAKGMGLGRLKGRILWGVYLK